MFAVFDGHGGSSISKYLKLNLPHKILNKKNKHIFNNNSNTTTLFNDIYNSIQNDIKEKHPRIAYRCGSTCCVGIHYLDNNNNHRLWILNVGDSRAVKCNRKGEAVQLSEDHKPHHKSERDRIKHAGGKIVFDGVDWRINDLSLSRAFGDLDAQPQVIHTPDIYNYKLSTYDKFIIFACDGLWDVINNQEAVSYVNKLISSNINCNYAKELALYAYKKGSLDNITIIVYSFY